MIGELANRFFLPMSDSKGVPKVVNKTYPKGWEKKVQERSFSYKYERK